MNKRDRFRFGNLHKRRIFGVIGVVAVLCMLSITILFAVGAFGDRSELVRIKLTNSRTGNSNQGVGINLDYIPTVNRISDASFETEADYSSYTVVGNDQGTIFINPHEAEGIVGGSGLRVFSLADGDHLSCIYESRVAGFDELRFGQISEILDYSGSGYRISKIAVLDNTIDVLTDDGRIMTDIISGQGEILEAEGAFFVDLMTMGSSIYAVDSNGSFYKSEDGHQFSVIATMSYTNLIPTKLILTNNSIAAICTNGTLLLVGYDGVTVYEPSLSTGIAVATGSDDRAVFVTSDNKVYVTTNFIAYSEVASLDEERGGAIDIIPSNNAYYVIHDTGAVSVISYGDSGMAGIGLIPAESSGLQAGNTSSYVNAIHYEDGIIAVNSFNSALLINESGIRSLSGESSSINRVFSCTNGRVLFVSSGKLYQAQLLAGIRVFDSIGEGLLNSGDVCMIAETMSPVELSALGDDGWSLASGRGTWDIYGENTSALLVESDDSAMGDTSLMLNGSGEGYHVLSQQLVGSGEQNFDDDVFYRMEVRLKQDNLPGSVKIWLSGSEIDTVGFEIEDVATRFTTYSYVFVMPGSMVNDNNIRFNIGFEGDGTLYVDNVYLGEDRYNSNAIRDDFRDSVVEATPSAIRLNNLSFFSVGYAHSEFYGSADISSSVTVDGSRVTGCNSLEQSMRLVRDAKSSPWLVIGSYATAGEINNLLDYLCAFNSSQYSEMRINSGTSLPWIQQFENIYIEINDENNVFKNDIQRGAYVDYIMTTIEQSEYYIDYRDRLVFIDGMNYDGGMMLSEADYHASMVTIDADNVDGAINIYDSALDAYSNTSFEAPRPVNHSTASGEVISSLTVNSNYLLSSGDIVSVIFNENSTFANLTMLTVNSSIYPIASSNVDDLNNDVVLNVIKQLSILNSAEYYNCEVSDPSSERATDTAESLLENCVVTSFYSGDSRYLIVSNHSTTQQQFIVDGLGTVNVSNINRCNANGVTISMNRLGIDTSRQVLQTGQFVIIECK